jgi:protein-disulfide isomerase/uncharacterized membrane protein
MEAQSDSNLWNRFAKFSMAFAVVGLALSVYATLHHYEVKASGVTDAFCNINDLFNCDDIARSPYSEVNGVPLGVWGVGFFLAQLALLLLGMLKPQTRSEHSFAYIAAVTCGVLVSIALGIIAWTEVGVFCLNCMAIYVVTLAQAIILYLYRAEIPTSFSWRKLGNGLISPIIVVAVTIVFFNVFLRPAPSSKLPPAALEALQKQNFLPVEARIEIDKSPFSGLGEDYRKGPDDAKVVLVEFADFQCPACKNASAMMNRIKKMYGDQILVVFKNYPLDGACNAAIRSKIHEFACSSAAMARCAGEQGKFWQMHDLLFERQPLINLANLKTWGGELGLSTEQIDRCLSSTDMLAKLKADASQGDALQIRGTPTIFLNGRRWQGKGGIETLQLEIDEILQSQN